MHYAQRCRWRSEAGEVGGAAGASSALEKMKVERRGRRRSGKMPRG